MDISMRDVAFMARVQRPVVSMWRNRFAEGAVPFPAPLAGRALHFDADAVTMWLHQTGRGNNPRPEASLPAIRLVNEALGDEVRAVALSAAATLRARYGDSLLGDVETRSAAELVEGVQELDRLKCFADELGAVDDLPATLEAVEAFVDEHLGLVEAHRWLTKEVLLSGCPELRLGLLATECSQLIARLATGLADDAPLPQVLDASGDGWNWLEEVSQEWLGEIGAMDGDSRAARHTRRCLAVSGREAQLVAREAGWPVAVVTALDGQADEVLGRAALVDDAQRRLVVGPARVLADARGAVPLRDELLRDGVVRAVVKLPAGLRSVNPREQLALWLVAERDAVPLDRQRTHVADLTGVKLTQRVVAGLVADFRASAMGEEYEVHRSWAILRPVLTRSLIARGGSLVDGAVKSVGAGAVKASVAELAMRAGELELEGLPAVAASWVSQQRMVTLETAIQEGWLRLVPGMRAGDLPAGDLPVWGSTAGCVQAVEPVDRLHSLGRTRAWLTEPGDVVFSSGPHAIVDSEGGALVTYPARVIRLAPGAPVVPTQLARAINAAARGTTYKQWVVAELDDELRRGLSVATATLELRRAQLHNQLAALNAFEDDLLDACETHLITLEMNT